MRVERVLVPWFHFGVNGGLGRFLNVARAARRMGREVAFASLDDDARTAWPDFPSRILTFREAREERWDAVMVPGAGAPPADLERLSCLRDERFGLRVQHILSDTQRLPAFELANRALAPHLVVLNNTHWSLADLRGLEAEGFHFLPGAVDTELFQPLPLKTMPHGPRFVIGGFSAKNPGPLLEAFRALGGGFELHWFGPTNGESGGSSAIRHRGPLFGKELARFYRDLDFFVSTETSAGWCNPAAEASASGVPIVVTRAGTVDFAEHLGTALVVDAPGPEAIADAIRRLVRDPYLTSGIARRAAERMRSFSWARYTEDLFEILEKPRTHSYYRIPELGLYGKWDPVTRMRGLEPLLESCRGLSVLDLGAAEGVVALELARRGSGPVHGLEKDAGRVDLARRLFRESGFPGFTFEVADLGRPEELRSRGLPARHDVVLFLGLYHHLPEQTRRAVLLDSLDRCGRYYAVRTPETLAEKDHIRETVVTRGFRLVRETAGSEGESLGWLGLFEREARS